MVPYGSFPKKSQGAVTLTRLWLGTPGREHLPNDLFCLRFVKMPGKRKAESTESSAVSGEEPAAPEDADFFESLDEELRAMADAVLMGAEDPAERLEKLEIQLRQSVFQRIKTSAPDLGDFWTNAARLCLHLVVMAEETPDNARLKDLNARKIPFVLLEDIFDCLSTDQCTEFWYKYCLGAFEIIFGQRIWLPSPTIHPCWLPFLKISNKLIRRLPPKDSGSILMTLCRVFPLSERSGTRWGSHNAANVTVFQDSEEFHQEQAQMPGENQKQQSEQEEGSTADYSFYESFWKLQQDLNHPNGLHAAAVPAFLQRLKLLITALESHTVAPHNPSPSDLGIVKYLTGSNLIAYQLKDPEFRIHILTQIIIVCHHMSAAGPTLRTKLLEWDNRSKALLKKLGPDGTRHLALLESIFARSEEAWRKWKKEKCQEDLDKTLSEPIETRKKRKSLGGTLGASDEEDEASQALTQGVLDPSELMAASKQMRSLVPSLETHLAEYVEALDPEAGIEAEYHPKNDKLFSWRALRVMSRDHLSRLPLVHTNGDFEGLVRQIYKEEKDVDIPGDFPVYDVDDFEEKEKEEEEEEEEKEAVEAEVEAPENETPPADVAKDTSMDAASEVDDETPPDVVDKVEANGDDQDSQEAITADASKENGVVKMDIDEENKTEPKVKDQVNAIANGSSQSPNIAPTKSDGGTAKEAKSPPPTKTDDHVRARFTPPPGKELPKYADIDKQFPADNGQRRKEDPVDAGTGTSGGRRARGGPGRGEVRGRGDRGRNQPLRNSREDRRAGREDRRSPAGREDRGAPPSGWSDRERGPASRREDHWMPPAGRGHDREDRRDGRGGRGGGYRGGERGPPAEHWEDQRRRREDRGDDRRDGDDRRPSRRRHRN